jgi:hypothetical protein
MCPKRIQRIQLHAFSLFLLNQSGRRKHGEVVKTAGFSRTRYEPEAMPEQPQP